MANFWQKVLQKKLKMISMPGCFTTSEALTALNAGADALKLFPASTIGPNTFKCFLIK